MWCYIALHSNMKFPAIGPENLKKILCKQRNELNSKLLWYFFQVLRLKECGVRPRGPTQNRLADCNKAVKIAASCVRHRFFGTRSIERMPVHPQISTATAFKFYAIRQRFTPPPFTKMGHPQSEQSFTDGDSHCSLRLPCTA